MILFTTSKLNMIKIDSLINKDNNWLFSDNKFSQFMLFNENSIIEKKSFYKNFSLISKIILSIIWIFSFYFFHFFILKINLNKQKKNIIIFNFEEKQSTNKIFENNNFDSYHLINLLSKKEVLSIYKLRFYLLIKNIFFSIKETLKVHFKYSYPKEVRNILLHNLDRRLANIVMFNTLFNSLKNDKIECIVYSGGAYFPSYASTKFKHHTYYYTHGLLGKIYKKIIPKFNKIYVFTKEEKKELEILNLGINIETYNYRKIQNHKNNIIIYTRGVDDSFDDQKKMKIFCNLVNFFKDQKFKIYVKKHPYYKGNFFNKINKDFTVLDYKNINNSDMLNMLKPKFVVSWYSTAIAEALYSSIIPINLSDNKDAKIKFKKIKITDWILFPIISKSLNWTKDFNKIAETMNNEKYYYQILNYLLEK